jgi:hypothetical protein
MGGTQVPELDAVVLGFAAGAMGCFAWSRGFTVFALGAAERVDAVMLALTRFVLGGAARERSRSVRLAGQRLAARSWWQGRAVEAQRAFARFLFFTTRVLGGMARVPRAPIGR